MSYDNLFSTWIKVGKDFDVSNVRDAMSAFNRLIHDNHKKLFDGIFTTLETGLSKLGENAASQTKAISSLIHLIKDIPMNSKQDYDVLGFIYEYLISMFAATAGKKAGEFYTPHEVSVLMSEIIAHELKDKKEIQIYDPTSGSGSLLINIGASVAKHMDDENNIRYYAQELKQNTYNLTRMNLVMRGIIPSNIVTRNADTLEEDWPYFDESDPTGTYNPLYIDAIVSNPPYSQKWDSENKESDPRYSRFGLAPKTKADYAFLLHDLYHLKPDGIMTIVLPHGVLFRGGEEGVIRKNLIEQNHIDAIIGLPANIFFGTGIPTIIIVLKQKRENTDILIVDASKGFEKVGKNNKLRASDIKKIADTVINRTNIDKYSRAVSRDEIRENDYNLNIPRYVDSSEADESFDIYATMFGGIPKSEIELLNIYWKSFPTLKSALFDNIESEYTHLKTSDIKQTIMANDDVRAFIKNFSLSFDNFNSFLKTELLEQLLTLKIQKEQTILGNDIFKRLENIPLIDKYEAYQLLDDNWQSIATDLEIIQTEGFEAIKQVDANMVIKKKNGKDVEVQEGWLGHIMPFDLVQNTYLKDELEALKIKEDRLLEITAQYEEILESLSEDEKEEDTVKESKDAFVNVEVVKVAKEIRAEIKKKAKFDEDSYELKMLKVDELISEEKALKKEVKEESEKLHIKTKKTIENLSDEKVFELLELKWIEPLEDKLYKLPNGIINNLVNKIQEISVKYETTLKDIENGIKSVSKELSSMLHELDGNEFDMQGLKAFQELLEVK
ncbi:type I restriction-modification system subunit M [Aliarcobacter butzleri]|uniref:type I restriction-modification system subunit M n=1 Tax=Aliarcobacter butzleri TaxID=28197 RepID=UPI0021B62AF3|nr:type I restriction-modification system subunit M [Aliarcobacter butzleri]MCT7566909.1 type I restriction-modification system subunit M [Aliarcobacter butzleri]